MARLLVRKTGKWYRLDQLKYVTELGSEGIVEAINELCGGFSSHSNQTMTESSRRASSAREKTPNPDDYDDTRIIIPSTSQCAGPSQPPSSRTHTCAPTKSDCSRYLSPEQQLQFYAQDEHAASLADLLDCLNVEELRGLARTLKLPNNLSTVSSFHAVVQCC